MSKTRRTDKRINLIVAMTSDYIIGYSNQLPWKFSLDLKRFRKTTTSHTVIMGRKTFESIGKPLPRRENIIVTTQERYRATDCSVAASLTSAIAKATSSAEIFVIGGGQLYREAMPIADRIYLTVIDIDRARGQGVLFEPFRGDTHFPPINGREWRIASLGAKRRAHLNPNATLSSREAEIAPRIDFRFIVLQRRKRIARTGIPGVTDARFDITFDDRTKNRKNVAVEGRARASKAKRPGLRDLFPS